MSRLLRLYRVILAHAFRNKSAFEATVVENNVTETRHSSAVREKQDGELTLHVLCAHSPAVQAEYANLNSLFSEFRDDGVYNPVQLHGPI